MKLDIQLEMPTCERQTSHARQAEPGATDLFAQKKE